ncbi:MAG: hypothetical protein ACI97R_001438, partial [Candidatus Azotimanducaceae bacterium]
MKKLALLSVLFLLLYACNDNDDDNSSDSIVENIETGAQLFLYGYDTSDFD